jgi:toxin CcdB
MASACFKMAQFDVYRNPNPNGRAAAPFVVSLQSDLLGQLPSRWVAPLKPTRNIARRVEGLMPEVTVDGKNFTVFMYECGAVPAQALGNRLATLEANRHDLIRAIDILVSGI